MTFPVNREDDHGRRRRNRYPGREKSLNRWESMTPPCHRIKTVSSLPMALSSAACLVLTMCWPAQACSSFMISATLPRRPGITKRAAGFSLGLVLFPPAMPATRWWARPAGFNRQNLPPSPPGNISRSTWGRRGWEGRRGALEGEQPLGMPSAFGAPFDRSVCMHGRAAGVSL